MRYQYVIEVTLSSEDDLDPVWVLSNVVGPGISELEPTLTAESVQANKYKEFGPADIKVETE